MQLTTLTSLVLANLAAFVLGSPAPQASGIGLGGLPTGAQCHAILV